MEWLGVSMVFSSWLLVDTKEDWALVVSLAGSAIILISQLMRVYTIPHSYLVRLD